MHKLYNGKGKVGPFFSFLCHNTFMSLVLNKSTIGNDMPVFSYSVPGTKVFTCLLAFPAGSLFEEKEGLAHLSEHLPFQGNSKHDSNLEIAKAAEDLGARINAVTSHTSVVFYIQGHAERANEMATLLAQCLSSPLFRSEDIEKEKGVITEEIHSCEQKASFRIARKTTEALYGDHPLSKPVIGEKDAVMSITREDILSFRRHFWIPALGGLFLAGDMSLVDNDLLGKAFAALPGDGKVLPKKPLPKGERDKIFLLEEDEEQTEVRLVWSLADRPLSRRERVALAIYSAIIGGNMTSQLFQEIREKRGLCYYINASGITSPYRSGLIISFALAPDKLEEVLPVVRDIVLRKSISAEEFSRAKNLLASDWSFSLESSFRVASSAASSYLTYGEEDNPQEIIDEIKNIDLAYVEKTLEMLQGEPSLVLRGPHRENSFIF
jgi:predicted Zn-dependent peptidase